MNYLVKTQLRLVAIAAVAFSIVIIISILIQSQGHSSNRKLQAKNDTEQHFWRAIGGVDSTAAETVENQLALDLKAVLDNEDAIANFRGDSNRYGGISDAIGYDPFNGTGQGCVECGPLDDSVQANLRLIASGNLNRVLASTNTTYDTSGYTTTPFGWSWGITRALGYLLIGTTSYLLALRIQGQSGKPDMQSFLSNPLLWSHYRIKELKTSSDDEETVRTMFPSLAETLDDIDRNLDTMPSSQDRRDLKKIRDDVMIELKRQAKLANQNNDTVQDLKTQLHDMHDYLRMRSEVRENLK